MRKIEEQMVQAVKSGKACSLGNTTVYPVVGGMEISLHCHPIAKVDECGVVCVNLYTLRNWPTNTTKSRLRALGVNICTKRGVVYVDGVAI